MAVSETWTDPDDLDRASGDVLTEAIYDGVVSNLAWLGGQTGTGNVQSTRVGLPVHNATGGSLAAGTLVYISGYNASSDAPQVAKSNAGNGNVRAAEWVLNAAIANGAAGVVYRGYTLGSLDTSAGSVGDAVYLSTTAGSWTLTAPTSGAQMAQRVGVVKTDHASTGSIQFDLPGEVLSISGLQIQDGIALTSPKISTDISDSGGNELFKVTATGSAVNEFTVANAAASGDVKISATGSDANIGAFYVAKGTDMTRSSMARQDDTSNTYEHTTATEYGWGFILGDGSATRMSEYVTFGTAFSAAPVVVIANGGRLNGSDPSGSGSFSNTTDDEEDKRVISIGTGGFTAEIHSSGAFGATSRIGYMWVAIGSIT